MAAGASDTSHDAATLYQMLLGKPAVNSNDLLVQHLVMLYHLINTVRRLSYLPAAIYKDCKGCSCNTIATTA